VEYAELFAQDPSRHKQGFNDGGQVWIPRDEFSNSSLKFDCANNADLEPKLRNVPRMSFSMHRQRYGEAFWRAHHEAWKRSDLNQREYCEAQGIPLKAFGNWRAKFKAEPQAPERKLLYRRSGLSHTLSHTASHMTNDLPSYRRILVTVGVRRQRLGLAI
jgi:hypothetical protein